MNPSGSEPVKLNPKSGGGIRCMTCSGPNFGTSEYYDLQVWCEKYKRSGSNNLDLGFGFECPVTIDKKKYFFGSSPFDIDELEVFNVNF